jgi:hypothetical protein
MIRTPNGPSPNSPAADPQTTAITAGTSITYYGDVHVGTIAERVGNPHLYRSVGMALRFLSRLASRRTSVRHHRNFRRSRADFEHTWQVFLSNRTEADFQAWRDQRDWTEPKYALWDAEAPGAVQPWTGQAQPLHEMSLRRGFRFAWPRGGADACARQHERVPTRANVN